jgi:hypothetical protein
MSPVLRTFDPARRAVLTTDASNLAVAAILTQQDDSDEGLQHPASVAYECRRSSRLTTSPRPHSAEELAVDTFFDPIVRQACRSAWHIVETSRATPGGTFLVLCSLLYRWGQGKLEADRLCIPAGGGLPRLFSRQHAWSTRWRSRRWASSGRT